MSMTTLVAIVVSVGGIIWSSQALAGNLVASDGKTYTGVVASMDENSVMFMWEKEKDQPAEVKTGDGVDLFIAQGHQAELREVPLAVVSTINSVPVDRFVSLFKYNLFYRTVQAMEVGRIQVASNGNFMSQVKGAAVLLLVLGLFLPWLMVIGSILLPGERLSYFGGVAMALVFSVGGLGAAMGSALATAHVGVLASAGAQGGLTILIIALFGLVTYMATKFSLLQGVAFTLIWGGSFYLASTVVTRFVL